jgi:hypothetical protein
VDKRSRRYPLRARNRIASTIGSLARSSKPERGLYLLAIGWILTVALTLMSLLLVWTTIFPIG